MRSATVPSCPASARSWMKSSPAGSWRIASSRLTTWRGLARLERVRPEPSTAWTPEPWERAKDSTTAAPAAGVPVPPRPGGGGAAPAEPRAEQLDQHLGEEVVRPDVGGVDDAVKGGGADHRHR